jgi:hypothetical protein
VIEGNIKKVQPAIASDVPLKTASQRVVFGETVDVVIVCERKN